MLCTICKNDVPETEDRCLVCGTSAGAPNVRLARKPEMLKALESRYQTAVDNSKKDNSFQPLQEFEQAVQGASAVINVKLDVLKAFLTNDKAICST